MTVIPAGHADVSVQLRLAGLNRPSFITFGMSTPFTEPDLLAEFVAAKVNNTSSLKAILSSSASIADVTVRLSLDGGEPLVGSATVNSPGIGNTASPPPNVAVLVHKRTARGGRRGRGRIFLPWCVHESNIDAAGILNTDGITFTQTAMNAMLTGLADEGNAMVLLHSTGATTPGDPNEVTSLVVQNLVASQRRRLGR